MIEWFKNLIRPARIREQAIEREQTATREKAERDLAALKERGEAAVGTLRARHARNHWQEAVTQMIQGAP